MNSAQDLYNFIYKACDYLRGPVGHESFKDYLTPLLYYKRLSDTWDEEYESALDESGGDPEYARLPEQHLFAIPEGCHWNDVRTREANLGSAIVEGEIRRKLVGTDFIEAVITLGDKIFYGTGLSPCILVLRWVKRADRVNRMLMVDGTKILTQKRAQNILAEEDVERLYSLYADFRDVEDFAKVVTREDVAAKGYDLSVNKYVVYHKEAVKSYGEAKADFDAALGGVDSATAKFRALLEKLGTRNGYLGIVGREDG